MSEVPAPPQSGGSSEMLRGVIDSLVKQLKEGEGDKEKRRAVEEWLRAVSEKYPDFKVDKGLHDYYLAEAGRLREEFDRSSDLVEKLNLGRQVESFLDRAAEYERRTAQQ
jgi:hypothetical protein